MLPRCTCLLLALTGCSDSLLDYAGADADRSAMFAAPSCDAGADATVVLGNDATLDGSGSSDPDGDPLTYRWKILSTPTGSTVTSADIGNRDVATTSFTPDILGTYWANLKCDDGTTEVNDQVIFTVTDGTNTAPIADASSSDASVVLGNAASLDGTASSDADGDALTYRWKVISVPSGSGIFSNDIANRDAASTSFTPDLAGIYTVGLKVDDGTDTDRDEWTIAVTDGTNSAPVADASASDTSGGSGDTIVLDASNSSDADGDPLTYRWKFVSVPVGSGLDSNSIANRDVAVTSFVPDVDGPYNVQVKVSDATQTDTDSFTVSIVTVSANAPVADAGGDYSMNLGDVATLDGTGSTDADGDPLSYRWKIIYAPVGSSVTSNSIADRDAASTSFTPDISGDYYARLKVDDGANADEDFALITVGGDTGDTGSGPALDISEVSAGWLVINEIMANPDDCGDADAEYFEIYNAAATPIDLNGMEVTDNAATYTISSTAIVGAGDVAVGVRSSTSRCYGLSADFEYTNALANVGDILEIGYGSTSFDDVDFSSWSVPKGASLELQVVDRDPTSNDSESSWCTATGTFAGATSDEGSPGSATHCD